MITPERFGSLVAVERLRRNAWGFVELAYDVATNRFVALWRVPARMRSPEIDERWREDITVIARLRHGHILKLVDHGDRDGQLWASFEFLNGVDWSRLLEQAARQAQLPPLAVAAGLVGQICDALAYLHPQGIFVQTELVPTELIAGFGGRAALMAPFNLRFLGRRTGLASQSINLIANLPAWLAPELRTGKDGSKEANVHSDIYTCGVLLWFALTGAPHSGEPETGHTKDRLREALQQWRVDVTNDLLTVLWRALQENPRNRFDDTRALKAALRASLDGGLAPTEEIGEYVDALFPGERDQMDRYQAGWRLEHGETAEPEEEIRTSILPRAPVVRPAKPAPTAPIAAIAPPPKSRSPLIALVATLVFAAVAAAYWFYFRTS